MSDEVEVKMIRLADEQPNIPVGVAFVDAAGRPGWIENNSILRMRAPSLLGCWPLIRDVEP